MHHSPRPALCLALDLADPATADALAERLRPELLTVLADRFGLPEEMIEELLGADPVQMRAALTTAPEEWLLGAAELGDPVVGRALWDAWYRDGSGNRSRAMEEIPGLLAAVLYAADLGDPRWHDDDGLVPLLYRQPEGPGLVAILTSGFPGLTAGTLAGCAPYLPPAVVVDACLALLEVWGSTEPFAQFLRLLEETPALDRGHPWLPDLLRRAIGAADPAAFLEAHRPAGEWEDPAHLHALMKLRYSSTLPVEPEGLDWDVLRREHRRLPIGLTPGARHGTRVCRLIEWAGCPADLVMESFREDPRETAWNAAELPFEAFTEPRGRAVHLGTAFKRGIREGRLPVDRVLAEVAPAVKVLGALPYDHEPTRTALTALLAPLGTDPVNWLTCYARMGRAPRSSVAELIAAVAGPGARTKRCVGWPRPREAEFPPRPSEHSRAAFVGMLRCASPEAQIAVVPYFDALAVQHFLLECDPSPAVLDAVVAAHGLPACIAVIAGRLDDAKRAYLLDLDEPSVDAELFRRRSLDRAEQERLLAGRLRGGGTRPVPQELLAAVDDLRVSEDRDLLTAGVTSGDLNVARRVVERVRLQVPATRLRLLVAVWERGGPDAVREILAMDRLPLTLRRRTEKLLDTPDGLDRIRALLADEESPDRLAAYLMRASSRPEKRLRLFLGEGFRTPWPALLAAHRAAPLTADLVAALVELPDCPRELLLAGLGSASADWTSWFDWVAPALARGTLTPDDLLTRSDPAELALDLLQRWARDRSFEGEDVQRFRDDALALTREHLGTDTDAWTVALHLLPTFAGTVPELLATAGAMTRVQA
ncbi:hypothetical protein [Streptomyces sp. NPDC053427]|uniref:hypothetical protein n=1 Tax=Streptomyces sp. NPDC053427 TaxID=3365701 RepID=UPI0037D986B7